MGTVFLAKLVAVRAHECISIPISPSVHIQVNLRPRRTRHWDLIDGSGLPVGNGKRTYVRIIFVWSNEKWA